MNIVTHGFRAKKTAVAIGNFDGVHLGHQLLLKELLSHAALSPVVFTFDRHPFSVLQDRPMPLITTNEEKCALLSAHGISLVYMAHSTKEFLQTSAEEFIQDYLIDALDVRHVVVGSDCRFGKNGQGTPALLEKMGKAHGFGVTCLPKLYDGDIEISSSAIRRFLAEGDVQKAATLMGHPYSIGGTVIPGRHVGTDLGIPTINLALPPEKLFPAPGVYETATQMDGKTYPSISFVGTSPTYQTDTPLLETHLLDVRGDFYGKQAVVSFRRFLRPTVRFSSPEALVRQIASDIKTIKEGDIYV